MALTPIIIEKWPEKPIILRQENDVNSRIFQIDLTDYIEEFGSGGTFGIRIQRLADGNIWTGEVEADGGIVTWTVPAAAVAKGGRGFIQFVYSIEGTLVANTPLIPTITPASIPTDENPPDPWLPWTEQIESEIAALERNKQDVLTFDTTPTADSQNPVTSGGVKAALDNKADKVMDATPGELAALDAAGNLRNSNLLASDVSAHLADRNNPHEVTKAQVGLGNVENTSDANKPISTAQQTALNGKADKVAGAVANDLAALDASGNLKDAGKKLADIQDKLTFDQTPTNGSANPVTSGGVYEALTHKAEKSVVEAIEELIPSQASSQNKLADKGFVNSSIATNTADYISNNGEPFTSVAQLEAYSGPVTNNDYAFVTGVDADGNTYYDRYKATVSGSTVTWAKEYRLNNSSFTTEQWAAIQSGITDTLVAAYNAHLLDRNNPHEVTKAQVGLGNVDNTSDANKPVSTAQQTALDGKADKVAGAVSNDLAALDASGNLLDSGKKIADLQDKLTFDQTPTVGSTNPVTSGGVKTALDGKADKVAEAVAGDLAALDASGNLTDSGKKLADLQDKLTFDQAPTTGSTNPVTSGGVKTALDGKADKVTGAVADDLAALDATGNLTDSGKKLADLQDKLTFDATPTAGSTNPVTSGGVKTALDGKADKVTGAVAGDLAALDASGNLTDSGKKLADLQTILVKKATNNPENNVFNVSLLDAFASPAISTVIKGKSVAKNQLVVDGGFTDSSNWSATNATLSLSNNIARSTCTTAGLINIKPAAGVKYIAGHVYYQRVYARTSTSAHAARLSTALAVTEPTTTSDSFVELEVIGSRSSDTTAAYPQVIMQNASVGDWIEAKWFVNYDLTARGFTASEYADAATLKAAWFKKYGTPLPSYGPYDAGSLANVNGEYRMRGINIFDEDTETGTINNNNGQPQYGTTTWRCKNFLRVKPNTAYYFHTGAASYSSLRCYWYDAEYNFISSATVMNDALTSPPDAAYLKIRSTTDYPPPYLGTVCVNESDASINGQYFPYYFGGTINLSSAPLNGVGTAQDEKDFATGKRTTRMQIDDMGDLTWYKNVNWGFYGVLSKTPKNFAYGATGNAICSKYPVGNGDAAPSAGTFCIYGGLIRVGDTSYADVDAFKTAVTGQKICYEIDTPTVTVEPIQQLETQFGYNVLEPISGDVQSAPAELAYAASEESGAILSWIAAQIAAMTS